MGRDKFEEPDELIEVLIELGQKESTNTEAVIKVIEDARGRILHVYPPYLIIALIPTAFISRLKIDPAIHSVDTEKISVERLEAASEIFRLAYAAWNEYLKRKSTKASIDKGTSLSWDAPGRLPPDPPPHMREILRRKEEEQNKNDKDLS